MRPSIFLSFLAPAFVSAAGNTISDTPSTYAFVTRHNEKLSPLLRNLCSTTDFFKYYKLNLFTRECPYFSEDGAFCGNRACAVDTLEEEDVPEVWRASVLGKLTGPTGTAASNLPLHTAPIKGNEGSAEEKGETCVQDPRPQDDRNFCIPEDEDSECVYVSLVDNEERYTGYHGTHAHAIWGSIYRENCFESHGNEAFESSEQSTPVPEGLGVSDAGFGEAGHAKEEFAQVLRDPLKSGHGFGDTCVEKRIFYRIISGMHASISTHICASYLNQLSGRWEANATCFDERLRTHPERVDNIYFNYVLVSRAVGKLKDYLDGYTFCSGDPDHDADTAAQVRQITTLASQVHYDESPLFEDRMLKEDFRNRFRNISMLMDCVGCDKCRLWGKVQTAGYGTALKVLFNDNVGQDLRRGELVALLNTYGRLSISLDALAKFNFRFPSSSHPTEGSPTEVSDSRTADAEIVLPPPELAHPVMPEHTGPVSPWQRLAQTVRPYTTLPTRSSLTRSLGAELAQFARALKFIAASYVNLPRNLWYHFFVTRTESSFWDFVFKANEREL